jgi:hypothetical protein
VKFWKSCIGLLGIFVTGCSAALPQDEVSRVLVVQNLNSPTSVAIASYYMRRHNLEPTQYASIRLPDSALTSANEGITYQTYLKEVEEPIRAMLATRKDTVRYIVLTKGIPIRVSGVPHPFQEAPNYQQTQSLDGTLAALDYRAPYVPLRNGGSSDIFAAVVPNLYWGQTAPFEHRDLGGYLVTRLDGYTESDAKALVDRALAPGPKFGKVLLDPQGSNAGSQRAQPVSFISLDKCTIPISQICGLNPSYGSFTNSDYNQDLLFTAEQLKNFPSLSTEVALPNQFSTGKNLIAYVSWGSNDGPFNLAAYKGLSFVPGAIAETAVSTSGRTFLPTTGGQSLIADLVKQGVTGVKGYSDEPYLDAIASPSLLLSSYFCGSNLATSYYRASRWLGWRDIVIGDPLAHTSIPPGKNCAF